MTLKRKFFQNENSRSCIGPRVDETHTFLSLAKTTVFSSHEWPLFYDSGGTHTTSQWPHMRILDGLPPNSKVRKGLKAAHHPLSARLAGQRPDLVLV
jgi:hypothetical protein